jgi:hypothetical protein
MNRIVSFATFAALLVASCDRNTTSTQKSAGQTQAVDHGPPSIDDLLCIQLPPLLAQDRKLIDVLYDLNKNVTKAVAGDPRGEIVIVRHHPQIDNGSKVLGADISSGALGEQLNFLTRMTLTHWTKSENGYVVYRTWHRPQYDFDDDDGLLAPE